MKWDLLEFKMKEACFEVSLDAKGLMKNRLPEFKRRLSELREECSRNVGNCDNCTVCRMNGDFLIYETESIHPKEKKARRKPLLLLLGNPAPHSVKERMFFSYEGNRREHRFWKVLDESGIFGMPETIDDLDSRNKERKRRLLESDYDSPFQIHLDVFYSMPSPSTGKWSGVAGLRRLFGKDAFEQIEKQEYERFRNVVRDFIAPDGLVIIFQKDAFLKIRKNSYPPYSLKRVLKKEIEDKCCCDPRVKVYCLAPTRLMQTNSEGLSRIVANHTRG